MKKRILLGMLGLLITLAFLALYSRSAEKMALGTPLPEVWYQNGNKCLWDVNNSGATAVIMLNPRCNHCRYEAESLNKNIALFTSHTIYLFVVTEQETVEPHWLLALRELCDDRGNNLHYGKVDNKAIKEVFGTAVYPAIFIFNRHGILRKKVTGEMKMTRLLEMMNQSASDD